MRRSIRSEAADLLACLASQPDAWPWTTRDCPPKWDHEARALAERLILAVDQDGYCGDHDWRERYAEAEARLREAP